MQKFKQKDIEKLEKYLEVKKVPSSDELLLWEKVGDFTPKFVKIPGILCICVCNSLAMNSANKDSDIDLFIITKNNRIWTVRLMITLLLMIHRQRKTASKHSGKFCLSFFVTESGIDLKPIAIKDDIYLSYWIQTLKPIIDRKNTFGKLMSINMGSKLKEGLSEKINIRKNSKFLTLLGDVCEKVIRLFLLPKTKKSFQKLGKPFGVIISDEILKFHDKDKRKEIRNNIFEK